MSTVDVLSNNIDLDTMDIGFATNNDPIGNIGTMRYQTERQTSIEKIVNDVLVPPLSDSSNANNANSGMCCP